MNKPISGHTRVVGLLGWPVEHTFSPAMHNAAFAYLGLDYVYAAFPVAPQNLRFAVEGVRGLALAGVNVTIPHKSTVMEFLDDVSPEARLIGAVNTIVNRDGFLTGYNTDAPGFLRSLEMDGGIGPRGKKILVLGAGGAARAVSIQLALEGAGEIVLASRVNEQIHALSQIISGAAATQVGQAAWDEKSIAEHLPDTDIVINATPLGMHPLIDEMPPLALVELNRKALVCDLVYNPEETKLLRLARQEGLKAINGLGMLLYQGVLAFEKWTGTEAPVEVMRRAFLERPRQ